MVTPLALELVGLHKAFGESVAVDHIALAVPQGSFYGIVGPNGAGKTTALSMAVGLLRPDEGSARIFGIDIWRDPVRAKALIGVLPDGLGLPERLTGRELLTSLGALRGLAGISPRVDELLAAMELIGSEDKLVIDYSTGMRKKIGLATALLHRPRLLVLDEPFEAVDPLSTSMLKAILSRFVAGGGTIVLSSHVMSLVEQICDHVAIIAQGQVKAAGPLAEVCAGRSLEEVFVQRAGALAHTAGRLSWFAA